MIEAQAQHSELISSGGTEFVEEGVAMDGATIENGAARILLVGNG